jgi:hypothetical protein
MGNGSYLTLSLGGRSNPDSRTPGDDCDELAQHSANTNLPLLRSR